MKQCIGFGCDMLDFFMALWHNRVCKCGISYAASTGLRAGFFVPKSDGTR